MIYEGDYLRAVGNDFKDSPHFNVSDRVVARIVAGISTRILEIQTLSAAFNKITYNYIL
jgi:hypothetical protein